jgi:DNA polymerase-3 subunit delta'
MTDAAANAMLKVLEEPQRGVVFVLVARSIEALVSTIPSRARTLAFASLPPAAMAEALAAELGISAEQAAWAAAASHGRLSRARALLTDEAVRLRRGTVLDLAGPLASGRGSDALAAAAAVLAQADEAMGACKQRQAVELAEFEGTYGKGRGSGAMRKRIETRHRRELRRVRFDAIRDALADLLGLYRDMALLGGGGQVESRSLAHPDRAATTARLARSAAGAGDAGVAAAAAIRAAAALEEADRRLAIGASPQLTLEAAFLSLQAALHGAASEMTRLSIR